MPAPPSPVAASDSLRAADRLEPGAREPASDPTPDDPRGPLPAGTELDGGRYRLGAPLGRGGFAITYDAVDVRLHRAVAIKELFPSSARRDGRSVVVGGGDAAAFARARERFLREATTLARFGHPSIVRIYAVFEERGTAYLVLERVEGRTLAAELGARGGPLSEAEALDVAVQLAGALLAVHRAGVLHRDVSPANLIRTEDGRIVLIDFGLARTFDDHTMTMTRIVTPGYAPPEQHAGEARFTPRADVYAVGATLHRLLSGSVPPASTRRLAGGVDVTPLWRVNPTVSRRVSDAVAAALALAPEDRPASVVDLVVALGVDPVEAGLPVEGWDPAGGPEEREPSTRIESTHDRAVGDEQCDEAQHRAVAPGPDASWRPDDPAPPAADAPDHATERAGEVDRSWRPSMVVARPALAAPSPTDRAPDPMAVPTEAIAPRADDRDRPADGRVRPIPPSLPAESGSGLAGHPWLVPAGAPSTPGAGGPRPLVHPVRPPGRSWVTLPLGLAAVALASCQPVGISLLLGLGVGPALATAGDLIVRRHRHSAWALSWWLRNLVIGAGRMLGPLLILATGLGVWWVADSVDLLAAFAPWVLRITGATCGWLLASGIGRGSHRFRSDVALDALAGRLAPRGRPDLQGIVLVIGCAALVAAGLWFRPEAWPFGG